MTTIAIAARTPRTRALSILFAASVLALAAQFAFRIPGTPVPISFAPFIVVLAGLMLGPVDGSLAMVAYLAAGVAGLPVFAPTSPLIGIARLMGPTGGYLLAYPVAAAVAGRFGAGKSSFVTRALAAEAGILVLLVGGLSQLAILNGSMKTALVLGISPFIALDGVKALVAAWVSGIRRKTV